MLAATCCYNQMLGRNHFREEGWFPQLPGGGGLIFIVSEDLVHGHLAPHELG